MKSFFGDAEIQNHPIRALKDFLDKEKAFETAKEYDKMRFVGYVLEIGFDTVTIITSDPFKISVGGIPRNSMLIMVPSNYESLPLHFILLRVLESAPTPLSKEVQQTYFELQKKSMPELDIFTQSELQWGALSTSVLGMFYPHPDKINTVEFSGDLNNFVSAHKYKGYSPNDELLRLIINTLVPDENKFPIGKLRMTECRLPLPNKPLPDVDVYVSTKDFMGARTAMFGKTRLGKSNVVKLIVQSLIETTKEKHNVGQLIFDINGEYANDNPQDDDLSIAGIYPEYCEVYALTQKKKTKSKPLKLNFYTHPDSSHKIISTLLRQAGRNSIYIESFLSVDIPNIQATMELEYNEKERAKRKILFYWAILRSAGFEVDETKLKSIFGGFDPGFNKECMKKVYGEDQSKWPKIGTLNDLIQLLLKFIDKDRMSKLKSSSNKPLFDPDDEAILGFLRPKSTTSAGPIILQNLRKYHSKDAEDFIKDIIKLLDDGKTVILDLGNANEEIMRYYSKELSYAVFAHQTEKFTSNTLGDHFIQLYFEEAHNLFAANDTDVETEIYRRFAKEGAKYHIGMVYSTQSPTSISSDLLAQTENFFIAHLASQDDVNKLAKVNIAFDDMKKDIMLAKTPGYVRMLTRSHRFVVSVQARRFSPMKSPMELS